MQFKIKDIPKLHTIIPPIGRDAGVGALLSNIFPDETGGGVALPSGESTGKEDGDGDKLSPETSIA